MADNTTLDKALLEKARQVAESVETANHNVDRDPESREWRDPIEAAILTYMQGLWRPVQGYEGRYEVSLDGQVRKTDGTILGQWSKGGYKFVRLSNPRALKRVHRMVAEAFIPNPENLPFVNHINHDSASNHYTNLEWCTQEHNLAHARAAGRMPDNYWCGRRSPTAKLSDQEVREIRNLYTEGNWSQKRLGEKYGVTKSVIGRLLNGETYADVQPLSALPVPEELRR